MTLHKFPNKEILLLIKIEIRVVKYFLFWKFCVTSRDLTIHHRCHTHPLFQNHYVFQGQNFFGEKILFVTLFVTWLISAGFHNAGRDHVMLHKITKKEIFSPDQKWNFSLHNLPFMEICVTSRDACLYT